jgi:hypothetical protein
MSIPEHANGIRVHRTVDGERIDGGDPLGQRRRSYAVRVAVVTLVPAMNVTSSGGNRSRWTRNPAHRYESPPGNEHAGGAARARNARSGSSAASA